MTALARAVPRLSLNRSEVALSLGFSTNTVDEMVMEGALPQPRRWRGRKVWLVSELEAALTEWPADAQHRGEEKTAGDDEDWTVK